VNAPDNHRSLSPQYYLAKLSLPIRESLSLEQLEAFQAILSEAIPKPSPKIVDLRFSIDLVLARFYFVLFVGKDRRHKQRPYNPSPIAKIGNAVAVTLILLGVNLTISGSLLLIGYLLKSMMSIDLFPGHFPQTIKHFLGIS
jgi:hypothetical protein